MSSLDYAIIGGYFAIVIGLGFWYQKKASQNIKAYFLGGNSMHWLALAMSGSVATFDITGTMWIVSILFVLGMKSMLHHWMWGFMMGAFFLAYMGKWVRRSKVVTAAEWMETRFGDDTGGRLARTAYALMAVITLTGFIGYAYQGIGKFASVYIPIQNLANQTTWPWLQNLVTNHPADCLAILVIGATTLYVISGGLYSVVITNVIQTAVLTIGGLFIAYVAWSKLTPEMLSQLPSGWDSLRIPWRIPELAGTEHASFEFFGALVILWVIKGLFLNAGGPAQMYDFQFFLSARNPRDAAKLGAAWSFFLVIRWAMTLGIVLLGLLAMSNVTDPEQVMPIVLLEFMPTGIRGIVIAGLLAAFMSTFSSTVNSAASFVIRDFWQKYVFPDASQKHLIRASRLATVLIVFLGILIGTQADSIAQIWDFLMMSLGAGVILPNILRWYWWRMNGWGYALGTFGGMALSLLPLMVSGLSMFIVFPLICTASLVLSVVGSLVTRPVEESTLISFYRSIRPFGLWRPVRDRAALSLEERTLSSESTSRTLFNVVVAMVGIHGLYLFPMYLVGHWYAKALLWLSVAVVAMIVLSFTWYRHLPEDHND
jgi:SSS family solute:Na+ symporter